MEQCAALVLAAGKGTRMHSERPKVMQTILGSPMLVCVYLALRPLFGERILTVIGHNAQYVQEAFPSERFIVQSEQLGTGHALAVSLPELARGGYERVLVVNGDAPLITEEVIARFLAQAGSADLAFATAKLDDPGAYGRVVRNADGSVQGIVEAKDYDSDRLGPASGEINVGLYLMARDLAETLLPKVEKSPVSGEYYITDLVHLALAAGKQVCGVVLGSDTNLLGVNSPLELSVMEEYLRAFTNKKLMQSGVIMHAPDLIRIGPEVVVEAGCELTGPLEIYGKSVLRSGARIDSHCVLRDCEISGQAHVHSFSHLDQAYVGEGALVGPYARLRPGAYLEEGSHVGNFVELKKARLGKGAKANHLTYLGDAEIGQGTNIGAGTITCNYDGKKKHKTIIGEHAFIGSNTALVAPVHVGNNALIGAGSTITRDVSEGNLSVARARQKDYPKLLLH